MPVHPDNGGAVRLFLALQTQWRWITFSTMAKAEARRTGLDYAAVPVAARMAGVGRLTPDLMGRLRLLEDETLRLDQVRGR